MLPQGSHLEDGDEPPEEEPVDRHLGRRLAAAPRRRDVRAQLPLLPPRAAHDAAQRARPRRAARHQQHLPGGVVYVGDVCWMGGVAVGIKMTLARGGEVVSRCAHNNPTAALVRVQQSRV